MQEAQKYYTVEEAARLLRLSRQSIYRLINRGQLHCVKVGLRRTIIPASAIENLIEAERGDAGDAAS